MSNKTREQHLADFEAKLDIIVSAHNLARSIIKARERPDDAHIINENTLIRVYEELDFIRNDLGDDHWINKGRGKAAYTAFVTLYLYRISIVHNRGILQAEYGFGKNKQPFANYEKDYKAFCGKVGVAALNPGDKLMLSATRPDFLLALLQEAKSFAREMLAPSSVSVTTITCSQPQQLNMPDTSGGTGVLGPIR